MKPLTFAIAVGLSAPAVAGPIDDARAFYRDYAADLAARDGAKVAARYHPRGATFMGDGRKEVRSRAEIEKDYAEWRGPDGFAWRDLDYRALGRDHILVTGLFDWTQGPDRLVYSYTGVLARLGRSWFLILEDESRATK